ncbi:hypothetical protein LLG10_01945 [bacterium]|nr:hypothetical protein [bacterium]
MAKHKASEYGISVTPTKIFYDKKGKEPTRHTNISLKRVSLALFNHMESQSIDKYSPLKQCNRNHGSHFHHKTLSYGLTDDWTGLKIDIFQFLKYKDIVI